MGKKGKGTTDEHGSGHKNKTIRVHLCLSVVCFPVCRRFVPLAVVFPVDWHPIAFVEPAAQIDQPATLAAERQRRAVFRLKLTLANRTVECGHDGR